MDTKLCNQTNERIYRHHVQPGTVVDFVGLLLLHVCVCVCVCVCV